MKEMLKKIANNNVESAFTVWRVFSPKMPKVLKDKIESEKIDSIENEE